MRVITFPDVEAVTLAELRDHMSGVLLANRTPPGRDGHTTAPVDAVVVRAVGGNSHPVSPVMSTAMVVVEGYSATSERARELCETARAVIVAAAESGRMGGVFTYGASVLSNPARLPDPDTGGDRYTATLNVRLRGTVTDMTD